MLAIDDTVSVVDLYQSMNLMCVHIYIPCSLQGSYKFLELLHNRGASLDIKDPDGQTPLHLVTRNRPPKCLEYLLRNLGPGIVDVSDNQKVREYSVL